MDELYHSLTIEQLQLIGNMLYLLLALVIVTGVRLVAQIVRGEQWTP